MRIDVPGGKIYFTTDGTKPDEFQVGRTGKPSTHKYIGPFRLQPGNRVVRAIAVTRDRLRESAVATRYIDVTLNGDNEANNYRPYSDHEQNDSSYSDEEQPEFMNRFPRSQSGVDPFLLEAPMIWLRYKDPLMVPLIRSTTVEPRSTFGAFQLRTLAT